FPSDDTADQFKAVGEIGPGYATRDCLDRIAAEPTIERFLFMVRNHADRVYSNYRQAARMSSKPAPFEEHVAQIDSWGPSQRYTPWIEAWINRFGADRVLVVTLEDVMRDAKSEQTRIANHLGIDPNGFPDEPTSRVNESAMPSRPWLYKLAGKTNTLLYRYRLYSVSNALKAMGLKRLMGFGKGAPPPPMTDESRRLINEWYADDVRDLQALVGRSMDSIAG
ncbi:MAG: sulfotransferase, partial [Planctomycetota bacterium]